METEEANVSVFEDGPFSPSAASHSPVYAGSVKRRDSLKLRGKKEKKLGWVTSGGA